MQQEFEYQWLDSNDFSSANDFAYLCQNFDFNNLHHEALAFLDLFLHLQNKSCCLIGLVQSTYFGYSKDCQNNWNMHSNQYDESRHQYKAYAYDQ